MSDKRKERTTFAWANHMKSSTFIQSIFAALAFLIFGYIVFYGDDRWFSKTKGEAIEKRQVIIESDSKHRDDMIVQKQQHMLEKLNDIHVDHKEDMSEMKGLIVDYLNSTR